MVNLKLYFVVVTSQKYFVVVTSQEQCFFSGQNPNSADDG